MSFPTSARSLVLQKYVDSDADLASTISSHFTVKDVPLPNPLPDDSLLVQTLYLSNDPAQRLWMHKPNEQSGARTDMVSIKLGDPFQAFSLSRVIQVGGNSGSIKVGDIVECRSTWADYSVVKKDAVSVKKEVPGVSLSSFLGTLGISGATAYMALQNLLKPKPGDTLVVSGAAGAVGNVAVQYAKKVLGVKRVVAIAGSDEKCQWLKSIGADEAINYKRPTFVEDLIKATPDRVDSSFDNVGGNILDEVLTRMNPKGIIAAVGAISTYNDLDHPMTIKNYVKVVTDRVTISGYSVIDYWDRMPEAIEALTSAVVSGKLITDGAETVVDIHDRLEEIPRVWAGLFSGANTGKLITKLAD
ncbi:NAD-binding protein [Fomitiporia mediterranea MF3/22]|uniref:NAD-binding protein n=1 Tax=Fomitiporia mediterranea (strain MF3/22) TaxID=694068 RepID=UPI00044084AE|nr:NAD-binding protein [Fomitiporia mediterranea MF3/22]EJD02364.1 NAD-binding protein [Fomitiporia mediterranea MF3/22]